MDDVLADLPQAVAQQVESLRDLGIILLPACGEIEFDQDRGRVKIGHVILADGLVEVVPRTGVTLSQLAELVTQAQLALVSGPDPTRGWREVEGVGWSVGIFQPIPC
ncbi:hypothetical protein [Nocardia farcinica]